MSATKSVRGGRQVEKPWGHELIWAEASRYVCKILHIEAGHQTSFQYHVKKEETIHLLRGVMIFESEGENGERQQRRVDPGESIHIPAGFRHRMKAVETCDILEVSTPELDDVIRLEDSYDRAGG
jgi:mannose-6-phosphate isomerase-like protein (cupin superfamily)